MTTKAVALLIVIYSTRQSLPAGTVRKANGHLSGRDPSILLSQTALPLKSPTGAFIAALRKRELAAWQAEQAHTATKEKQEVPAGELPVLLIVCGFLQGASFGAHPVFVLSESACGLFFWRIIRFNTQHPVADPHMGLNQMQRMCA